MDTTKICPACRNPKKWGLCAECKPYWEGLDDTPTCSSVGEALVDQGDVESLCDDTDNYHTLADGSKVCPCGDHKIDAEITK